MSHLRYVAISAAILLAGCSVTDEDLREDPGEHGTFHVALPYQVVYANFIRRAESCYTNYNDGYTFVAHTEIEEGKSGTVNVGSKGGMGGPSVFISADIVAALDGTDVTYVTQKTASALVTYRPSLVEWANGTGTKCARLFNQ